MENENKKIEILSSDVENQINEIRKRDAIINANMEDIMIDLHNNCEFMGNKMASLVELIKDKTDEEIKASTINYRKAYDTLIKVAILIGIANSINIIMLIFLIINHI